MQPQTLVGGNSNCHFQLLKIFLTHYSSTNPAQSCLLSLWVTAHDIRVNKSPIIDFDVKITVHSCGCSVTEIYVKCFQQFYLWNAWSCSYARLGAHLIYEVIRRLCSLVGSLNTVDWLFLLFFSCSCTIKKEKVSGEPAERSHADQMMRLLQDEQSFREEEKQKTWREACRVYERDEIAAAALGTDSQMTSI